MAFIDLVTPWWEKEDEAEALRAATGLFQEYVTSDQERVSLQDAWDRLYMNRELTGNSILTSFLSSFSFGGKKFSRIPINVAKVMIDAVFARVTRQVIAIKFLTDTHNFDAREGAEQMQRYVQFQERQQGGEAVAKQAYLDSLRGGTGIIATEDKFTEYDVEQCVVKASDVFADPQETVHLPKPTNLFRRQWVSRHRLKAMFPEYEDKIMKAGQISPDAPATTHVVSLQDRRSLVEVVHGWRLPSFKGAGDGKYIMFVDDQVLKFEDWELEDFPLTFIKCEDNPTNNFWGVGLCEQLLGIHFDINTSFFSVYRTVEMVPRPVLFLTAGAKVNTGKIGNADGLIIESVDGSPRLELPMSVPRDIVDVIMLQWYKALEISGLASLSMPQSTGGGFETGQAVRDFNDIQSTELAPKYVKWQDFRVRTAEQIVSAGKRVANRAEKDGTSYKLVLAKDKHTIEEIDWSNISLDPRRDSYVIQALPASALSQTFAGKKADVLDLLNAGLIDREQALTLMDFPDLDEFFNSIVASRKVFEKEIQQILKKGVPVPVDPNNNVELGLKMYQEAISKAVAMDVPQERISLLRSNVTTLLEYIKRRQMATQNMAAGFGPGLPGSPSALNIDGNSPQASAERTASNAY